MAGATLFGYAWGNRTDEFTAVAPFTNIYTVLPTSLTENCGPFLATLAAQGVKALIALQQIVADATTGLPLADWSARLDTWKAAQGNSIDARVEAFYLPDEPYHVGWTKAQLNAVSNRVKVLWPNHKQMMIEGYQKVRSLGTTQYPIPTNVYYIGWDRYGTLQPHTDTDYVADFNWLKSKMGTNRKMVIVGESQWLDYYTQAGYTMDVMGPMFESYYMVAQQPEVGVFFCYLLPNGFDSPDHVGLFGLPQSVIDLHVDAGTYIKIG